MRSMQSFSTAEQALHTHGALDDLRALVNAGCDRVQLLNLLDAAFLADSSWKALVGMDFRQFKKVINNIRDCGAAIDRLYSSELFHRLAIEDRDPWFLEINELPTLPDQLRGLARAIEHRSKLLGPKLKTRRHAWKACIVATVLEETDQAHDPEVSSIIAAVLDAEYSEKAHQQWRRTHRDMVKKMRKHLQQQRRRIIPRPLST